MEPISTPPPTPEKEDAVVKNSKMVSLRKSKFFIPGLIIILLLLIGIPTYYFLGVSKQNEVKESVVPTKTVSKPTATTVPTIAPTAMLNTSIVPTKPLSVSTSVTPSVVPSGTKGTINLSFQVWDSGGQPITGVSTKVHVGGSGVDQSSTGSPNWSSSFAPGTYDINSEAPPGYSIFMFQECTGDGCGQGNNGNVQNCGFKVELKAGANLDLKCLYQKH